MQVDDATKGCFGLASDTDNLVVVQSQQSQIQTSQGVTMPHNGARRRLPIKTDTAEQGRLNLIPQSRGEKKNKRRLADEKFAPYDLGAEVRSPNISGAAS